MAKLRQQVLTTQNGQGLFGHTQAYIQLLCSVPTGGQAQGACAEADAWFTTAFAADTLT